MNDFNNVIIEIVNNKIVNVMCNDSLTKVIIIRDTTNISDIYEWPDTQMDDDRLIELGLEELIEEEEDEDSKDSTTRKIL